MPEWGLAREGSTGHLVHRTSFSAVCLSEYNWFNGSHSIRGRSGCSIVSSCNITAVAPRNVEWWHSHTLCAQLWGVLKGRASCKNRWLILLTFISDPHLKTWEFPLNVCLRKSVKTSFTHSSTQHFGTSPGREERDIQAPHSGGPEEWWEREIFLGIWPWNGAFFFFLKRNLVQIMDLQYFVTSYGNEEWNTCFTFLLLQIIHVYLTNFLSFFIFHVSCVVSYKT